MKRSIAYAAVLLACGAVLPSCALTEKSQALSYRYFTVDASKVRAKAAALDPARVAARLRIGRVTSSGHLRNWIVYRTSPVEVGVYEELRWTERPEEYVRRALTQALFGERGLTQIVAGSAPTLDVQLLAFEEVRKGRQRLARVSMHFALHDERTVIAADTITIDVPARGHSHRTEDVVEAISSALNAATAQLADEVTERLTARRGVLPEHARQD